MSLGSFEPEAIRAIDDGALGNISAVLDMPAARDDCICRRQLFYGAEAFLYFNALRKAFYDH
jgi:hypothetical protein